MADDQEQPVQEVKDDVVPGDAPPSADAGAPAKPAVSEEPAAAPKSAPAVEEEQQAKKEEGSSKKEVGKEPSSKRDDKERDRKESSRDKDKDREKEKDKERDRKSSRRSRSRSRDRKRRSRSRSRDKKRRSRSRSGDRRRKKSRSRSRDRKKASASRRSRSRSRDNRGSRRSRSRDRDRDRDAKGGSRRSRSRERRAGSSRRSRSPSTESDVGGYKPRKRVDGPVITNGPGTGSDPFANYRQKVTADPQQQLRSWQLQQLQARVMVLEQQAKSAATATSKTQREVYVGGLMPGTVSGEALRTLFNTALSAQFAGQLMAGMDPVINVNMHPEGKYAFVEFRMPEMATAALQLHNQVTLMNCTISVARPSGYVDPTKAMTSHTAAKAALAALERGDMAALAEAVANGANLQGLGLPLHIVDPASAATPALPPGVVIDGASAAPTLNCCFLGMVTAARLADDAEYSDMKEDLTEQCNEYAAGCVVDVKIPRPVDPALSDQYIGIANYGKIFVKFTAPAHAQLCKDKLHGRLYDGQLVQVFYITDEAYARVT